MKLHELIDTKTKTKKNKSEFDLDKLNVKRNVGISAPNSGSYAYGKEDKKDPHIFRKKHYLPSNLEHDAYYQYIKAIQPFMAENPYFPRVYIIDMSEDSKGNIIPEYNIEKLHTQSNFSLDSLIAMAKRMFFSFPLNDFINETFIINKIARYLSESVNTSNYSNIKDNNLKGALMLIQRLIKNSKGNFRSDFGLGNLLLRGTPQGPQLVLSDPLFDPERKSMVGLKR